MAQQGAAGAAAATAPPGGGTGAQHPEAAAAAPAAPWAELPPELVPGVLAGADQATRLGAAALVARAWRAASVAATRSIALEGVREQAPADGLQAWLAAHGGQLSALSISGSFLARPRLQLPWAALGGLCELHLERVELASLDLAATPGLSALVLERCRLWPDSVAVLAELQHLRSLRIRVELTWVSGDDRRRLTEAIGHAMSRLVGLTHLAANLGDIGLAPVAPLTNLLELQVFHNTRAIGGSFAALPAALPASLTSLVVPYAPGLAVGPATTPRLAELTGLRRLVLQSAQALDAAVLSGLVRLSHLDLARSPVPDTAALETLLGLLPRLHQLQHLGLAHALRHAEHTPAVAFSALAACSRLTRLDLGACALPAGAAAHLWPPGVQLPALRELRLFSCKADGNPLLGTGDLGRLAAACPGLRALDIEATQPGADWLALAWLSVLTRLQASNVDLGATQALAALPALQNLALQRVASDRAALALTSLRALTCLGLGWGSGLSPALRYKRFTSQAPAGSPPNVWRQLLEACAVNSEQPECLTALLAQQEAELAAGGSGAVLSAERLLELRARLATLATV